MSASHGVVAAGHGKTVRAVEKVLAAGGNAFDGAVAGAAMACVAEPVLASLGGGGFLVTRTHTGDTAAYDFFAQTPKTINQTAAATEVFADFGTTRQPFQVDAGSMATPGMAPGLEAVHRDLGSMAWKDLIAPAIAAARAGIETSAFQAHLFRVVAPIYRYSAQTRAVFARFGGGDDLPRAGDTMQLPEMADSLATLAAEGAAPFTDGALAAAMVGLAVDRGHLTMADLTGYQVARRAPLQVSYRDGQVLMNPAPACGGLLVAFGLNLLSAVETVATPGSAEHGALLRAVIGLTGEARVACSATHGGDLADMLDPAFLATYRKDVLTRATARRGTTHISVIDRDGNAASMTLSNGEGCGLMAGGFMVNNMLGEADLIPAEGWVPDRRLASMMAPSIVTWPDGRIAVLGSGGSARIRSAVLQVMSHLIDGGLAPSAAVARARIHAEDGAVDIEPGVILDGDVTQWPAPDMFFGGVHVAARAADGTVTGCGDARRGGAWQAVTG